MPTAARSLELVNAYFPGARGEGEPWIRDAVARVLGDWSQWRTSLFPQDDMSLDQARAPEGPEQARLAKALEDLCQAFTAETPTCTPRYIGHMKADISTPALLGSLAAMLHNPNNTSREASKIGIRLEAEAIAMLADMLGFDPAQAQGHFTSGGTVANLEAVWRARYRMDHWLSLALYLAEQEGRPLDPFRDAHMGWDQFRELWTRYGLSDEILRGYSAAASSPTAIWRRLDRAADGGWHGPVLLAPGTAHYSWRKAANLLGLGEDALWSVALDARGRMDLDHLQVRMEQARAAGRPILMTVAVAGATETGQIDPVDGWQTLREAWRRDRGLHIWGHVDAAYGGFFSAARGLPGVFDPGTYRALDALGTADSLTIDPHKLGYTPYACGALLTGDAETYAVSGFDAPYLARPELGSGKWASTLEGSRSAAGAVATWLTGRTLGFNGDGLGAVLGETVRVRRAFESRLGARAPDARILAPADTNISCFSLAAAGEPLSVANRRTAQLFDVIHASPAFSVSRTTLKASSAAVITQHVRQWGGVVDASELTLIRCVFMSPYWTAPELRERLFEEFGALVDLEAGRIRG